MSQQFYKGRTDNHLTWVMVDATDFATPESAMSAATKIKIYGKLRAAAGVNFVSSGTGSLTNDITHVGASVNGIYSIGLVKADLSDASAAWYDQYIISLSATGAAYQTLVVDGGIDASGISTLQSRMSDMQSFLTVMSAIQSDVYSALIAPVASMTSDIASAVWAHAVGAQVNSRILLTQSFASDAASAAVQGNSRTLLTQSLASDAASIALLGLSMASDAYSAAVLTQSLASDVHSLTTQVNSRVLLTESFASDAASAAVQANSRVLLNKSSISDVQSYLVAMSSAQSDIYSAVGAITVTVDASAISDIASAVIAGIGLSGPISDIYSLLSDVQSDFQSRVPKLVATDSQLTSLASDVKSAVTVVGTAAAAVKVQTDKLTFTVANQVDANVQYINDTALIGDGNATPWGPA